MRKLVAIVLSIAAITGGALLYQQLAPHPSSPISAAAPSVNFVTLDGKTLSLASLRGHWVLINFWASWCAPCIDELPNLVRAQDQYGGLGLSLSEASVIMEEINRSGGHSAACHAQMYTMGALLRHGNEAQKRAYLPGIASGGLRLQAFSITEEQAGSDTRSITTAARREGDEYVIDGHKNWTSRIVAGELKRYDYPRWQFTNVSADIRELCCWALDLAAVPWKQSNHKTISVSTRAAVARLDTLIGVKR